MTRKKYWKFHISNEKTVDECIANKCAPPFYDTYKITVTTGKDMLKLYEHEGMTQDEYPEDEIFNCYVDTAYVFVLNH